MSSDHHHYHFACFGLLSPDKAWKITQWVNNKRPSTRERNQWKKRQRGEKKLTQKLIRKTNKCYTCNSNFCPNQVIILYHFQIDCMSYHATYFVTCLKSAQCHCIWNSSFHYTQQGPNTLSSTLFHLWDLATEVSAYVINENGGKQCAENWLW